MIANTHRAFGQFKTAAPTSTPTGHITARQSQSCGTLTVTGDPPGTGDPGVDPGDDPTQGDGFAMSPTMIGGAGLVMLLLLVR